MRGRAVAPTVITKLELGNEVLLTASAFNHTPMGRDEMIIKARAKAMKRHLYLLKT